jgi:hypothetical protein
MSQVTKGFVEDLPVKHGKSKASGKPYSLWAIKVDGQFYNTAFDKPTVAVGDYVSITWEKDDRGYNKVLAHAKETPPAAAAAGPASATNPAGDRNSSIVYQSSRKDAIELLKLMFDVDALPISAAKTAAGKASRFQELKALTDKLTVELFYDVITLRNLDRVQDAGAETSAEAALPEDEQLEASLRPADWQ